MAPQAREQSWLAEILAVRARRLDHAVGEKEQAASRLEADAVLVVARVRNEPDRQVVPLDLLRLAAARLHDGRALARRHEAQLALPHIEHTIDDGEVLTGAPVHR